MRAFGSRNSQVVTNVYELVATIGGLADRAGEYIAEDAIKALVKIYRTSEDWTVKQKTLNFFVDLFESKEEEKTAQLATLMTDYGAPIMMASDFVKFAGLESG